MVGKYLLSQIYFYLHAYVQVVAFNEELDTKGELG